MQTTIKVILLLFLFFNLKTKADDFNPEIIISRMEKAADWQINNPTPFGDLEWHCAPFYASLTDLYEVSGREKYLNYVKSIGEKHDWKIQERKYHADDHAVALSYIRLFQQYKNPEMIVTIQKENGRLINIQPLGGVLVAFDPETTAIFGVGGFISAGSEVVKMVQKKNEAIAEVAPCIK